ncbi:VOC family protein [Ancylobacter amanitiformis]|uniref:Glyoxalase superfamily protein PhnB n=1 Tax=Ancylobacter amanitiformis TaxID=217069 RepID=A0ABU0LVQ5_9HYPH|nr:VOC family protein [Ancylobacter amanitiformis]MDQ0512683.1 putative glyoxalase superfamily protein PhnB [Ancylobacter amanitiformis]
MGDPVPGDLVPFIRYADPRRAIAWLQRAFGFAAQMVIDDGAGGVAHAELVLGSSAIMIGGCKDDILRMRTPAAAGGVTQGVYIVVADADFLWRKALDADAEVVMELYETPYGSREFAVRDPEGHLWSIGTYRAGSYVGG